MVRTAKVAKRGGVATAAGGGGEAVGRGIMGDGVRGEDGRGHYGNHGWVSGLRVGEMVWVMFQRALEWISLALLPNGVSQC